ncbi:MAG: hypothetical protein IPM92_09690 [Saprospiraceae bacterium]|nr:hypothetical protein [Saprospiraceae bacterium]
MNQSIVVFSMYHYKSDRSLGRGLANVWIFSQVSGYLIYFCTDARTRTFTRRPWKTLNWYMSCIYVGKLSDFKLEAVYKIWVHPSI